jgi:general secretion pathway protein D
MLLRVLPHKPDTTTPPDSELALRSVPVASDRLARSSRFAQRPWSGLPRAVLLLALAAALAVSAPASSRKAKSLYDQGRKAEVAKDYDNALELYQQAMDEEPGQQRYELATRRIRFIAAEAHVNRGQELRDQDQLEEAVAEFQRAMEIDPSLSVARQEYERTLHKLEKRRESGQKNVEQETTSALDAERHDRDRKIAALKPPPDLQPISTQPINFTISNQDTKVIFETIGKLAGINVLMDPEYQDKKMSVELTNLTLYDALDYVSLLAKAFWKPISHNAIFVTNDNQNKRRDYEEEVVKTFYLTNVATPQEMQEIMTAIRGLTDLRRMFPVNSMNALVIRGSEAKMALAEKVINDVDKPRAEVLIDVLVIETSKTNTRELGIAPMSGTTPGIDIPVSFAPKGGTTTTTGSGDTSTSSSSIPLSNLGKLSTRDWNTTLPGGRISALLSASDSRLLQSPRVRTADGFPASIRIGDRIPIATGSFQPGVGGVGINPLVNTQFNFEDVGVNVDLTPKIHNDREISLHIEVEISNVRDHVDIGGIQQPIIGQRKITHDIRIVEGEASVMGGLNQTQTFKTKAGVPFLGEVPILGNLFSTTKTETNENEILIVLIPHIVRLPQIDDVNLQEIASGTDSIFQVRSRPQKNGRPALPEVGARAPQAGQESPALAEAQPPAAAPATAGEPATAEPAAAQPAPAEPSTDQPAAAEPPPAVAPQQPATAEPAGQAGGQPRFLFEPASVELAPGARATVNVIIENATQLFGSPLRIGFDPRVVRVTDITKGTFLEGDGMDLIFAKNIRGEVGQAAVNISRFPGTGGSDGRGILVTLQLEGVAAGNSKIGVTSTGARNADAQPVRIAPVQLPVIVR